MFVPKMQLQRSGMFDFLHLIKMYTFHGGGGDLRNKCNANSVLIWSWMMFYLDDISCVL